MFSFKLFTWFVGLLVNHVEILSRWFSSNFCAKHGVLYTTVRFEKRRQLGSGAAVLHVSHQRRIVSVLRKLKFLFVDVYDFRLKEWLDIIQYKRGAFEKLKKLYKSPVVCSKHFQPNNGGLQLYIKNNKPEKSNSMGQLDSWTVFILQAYNTKNT